MKLLIAEDHPGLQKSMELMMKLWGFDYDLAANGQEAVIQAKRNRGLYDLCIMDVEMPIMNGCEATRIMRRDLGYFPIMAYSGNYSYREECINSGADAFVEKPCSPHDLLAKIRELAVKTYQFVFNGKDILLKKEMPMDQQHAKEIRQLKEKGLVKVKFCASGEELILHMNTTNKISHDFNRKGQLMSVFLNRDPEKPTRCELYREHCHVTQTYLDDSDFDSEASKENEELERYTERALKAEEE